MAFRLRAQLAIQQQAAILAKRSTMEDRSAEVAEKPKPRPRKPTSGLPKKPNKPKTPPAPAPDSTFAVPIKGKSKPSDTTNGGTATGSSAPQRPVIANAPAKPKPKPKPKKGPEEPAAEAPRARVPTEAEPVLNSIRMMMEQRKLRIMQTRVIGANDGSVAVSPAPAVIIHRLPTGPATVPSTAAPTGAAPAKPKHFPLRIFMCQKNETTLLKPWLDHALSIVDQPSDVRVIDDFSTDPAVVETLQDAEAKGVQVVWVRPPQMPAFLRKNVLFTRWVQEFSAAEPAFYVPLDCDEFLAARGRIAPGIPVENVQLAHATLPINTMLSHKKTTIRQALQRLSPRGYGTSTIRRLRNFSHVPGLFSDIREHKWCGINRKIIVFGSGKTVLQHALAVPDRGYHDVVTGVNHGAAPTLCLVEFHNMPYGERQRKSLMMSGLVPSTSKTKYLSEGYVSQDAYEKGQEKAAHMQPTARAINFAALLHSVVFDFDGAVEFTEVLKHQFELMDADRRGVERRKREFDEPRNAEETPPAPAASPDDLPSMDDQGEWLDAEDAGKAAADRPSAEDQTGGDKGASESLAGSAPDPESTAEDDEKAIAEELPVCWMALSEEERAEVAAGMDQDAR
jgi:hypothetical protein